MRTDIGLGETKHDVYIRAYSRHDPLHDGYEMVSVDGVDHTCIVVFLTASL